MRTALVVFLLSLAGANANILLNLMRSGNFQGRNTEEQCGLPVIQPRILGGHRSPQCVWPFSSMVSIRFKFSTDTSPLGNLTFCSGALIDSRHVLTVGFCMQPFATPEGESMLNNVRVIVGEFDTRRTDYDTTTGQSEEQVRVEAYKIHPDYDVISGANNIAILRLATPVQYNRCKLPACLPGAVEGCVAQVDNNCKMTGWGSYTADGGTPYPVPLYADMKLLDSAVTAEISRLTNVPVPQGTLMGYPHNPNQKPCLFDWGGLVVCYNSGRWTLRGLISQHTCMEPGDPPVLPVNVEYYNNWIQSCKQNINTC